METARKIAPIEAPPSSAARATWDKTVNRARDLDASIFAAGLRLAALGFTYSFAARAGVALADIPVDLEQRFAKLQADNEAVKTAVRNVDDRVWGARWTGHDFDIVAPYPEQLSGVFIPIMIGVGIVALSGLITRLAYLEAETTDLSDKYNSLLDSTDKTLCADPMSETCQSWQVEKETSGYNKNRTFADSIKSAASSVGAGLGKGIMIAVPLLVLALFWKR